VVQQETSFAVADVLVVQEELQVPAPVVSKAVVLVLAAEAFYSPK